MFHWPLMVWQRLLHSPRCTTNASRADLFLVPAYRYHPSIKCPDGTELIRALVAQNPELRTKAASLGPRHILMESRALEQVLCGWR